MLGRVHKESSRRIFTRGSNLLEEAALHKNRAFALPVRASGAGLASGEGLVEGPRCKCGFNTVAQIAAAKYFSLGCLRRVEVDVDASHLISRRVSSSRRGNGADQAAGRKVCGGVGHKIEAARCGRRSDCKRCGRGFVQI